MPTYYPENPELDKRAKNYLRTLKRRQSYLPAPELLRARGGPFHSQEIALTPLSDNKTAVIRVGADVGYYERRNSLKADWVPILRSV